MKKKLVIIGAGGFGREVADTVKSINQYTDKYELLGFIDDDAEKAGKEINGIKVIGDITYLLSLSESEEIYAVIAMASASLKKAISQKLEKPGGRIHWENVIHPTAIISESCQLGEGVVMQAHSLAGPNSKIEDHCMVNVNSTIGHDAILKAFSSVMCHCDITGGVQLGEGSYLGSGVKVVPGVVLGDYSYICAGSVIFSDVKNGGKVIGNPGRLIVVKNE